MNPESAIRLSKWIIKLGRMPSINPGRVEDLLQSLPSNGLIEEDYQRLCEILKSRDGAELGLKIDNRSHIPVIKAFIIFCPECANQYQQTWEPDSLRIKFSHGYSPHSHCSNNGQYFHRTRGELTVTL